MMEFKKDFDQWWNDQEHYICLAVSPLLWSKLKNVAKQGWVARGKISQPDHAPDTKGRAGD